MWDGVIDHKLLYLGVMHSFAVFSQGGRFLQTINDKFSPVNKIIQKLLTYQSTTYSFLLSIYLIRAF